METAKALEPYQQRVVDERIELDHKRDRLAAFTKMEIFDSLPLSERARLLRQLSIMDDYSGVLKERIDYFKTL